MQTLTILGSTGSIGVSTLDVVARHPDRFQIYALAGHRQIDKLAQQCAQHQPKIAIVANKNLALNLQLLIQRTSPNTQILYGEQALIDAATAPEVTGVMCAIVGAAGLPSALAAARHGKTIYLANKETLVVAGSLFMETVQKYGARVLPIDSEHNAIFQVLPQPYSGNLAKHGIQSIILTASGGPFRGYTREQLAQVTLEDAMKHPTWNMGRKVTLDSATMFNKGLEVIEARWLFDVDYDHIEVLVQPQSLIHSMVEYEDGSVIAQIGNPDMHLPIQFALTYPHRLPSPSHEFVDWKQVGSIITEQPDVEVFRSLRLAFEAGKRGGNATTAFNAANEEAIASFIKGQLSFLSIFDVVEETLTQWTSRHIHSLSDVLEADKEARRFAKKIINRGILC